MPQIRDVSNRTKRANHGVRATTDLGRRPVQGARIEIALHRHAERVELTARVQWRRVPVHADRVGIGGGGDLREGPTGARREHDHGHTGFTGTSIWIDPERELFVVLLTNRVYAPRARRPSEVISNVRNDLADAAALSITDDPEFPRLDMPAAFRADTARSWNRR